MKMTMSYHSRSRAVAMQLLALFVLSALSPVVLAQISGASTPIATTTDKLPEFEVATIRPADLNKTTMVGIDVKPGGRVILSGLTLKGLIHAAFHVEYWQISGGDDIGLKLEPSKGPIETLVIDHAEKPSPN